MSKADELKAKNENLFERNTILLNENERLKKENAELKHTIAELRRDKDNLNTHTKAQEKLSEYHSDQLTKAKKLLKQFLEAKNSEDTYKAEWEAEQFLKEIEK